MASGALVPEIRARHAEVEAARQLPADLAERLRATGLFARGLLRRRSRIRGGAMTRSGLIAL
jgi:hypothetical protein